MSFLPIYIWAFVIWGPLSQNKSAKNIKLDLGDQDMTSKTILKKKCVKEVVPLRPIFVFPGSTPW